MGRIHGGNAGCSRWLSNDTNTHQNASASRVEIRDSSSKKRSLHSILKFPSKRRRLANKKGRLCSVAEKDVMLVDNSSSTYTENEAAALLRTANISFTDYKVLIPSEDQRANKPPEGYMSVYEVQIEAGLRFPLHDLVIEVCKSMCISPSQLGPNAHRAIVCFILCAQFYKIPVTADYFFSLFEVNSGPIKSMRFRARKGLLFLADMPRIRDEWRTKFFFIRPLKASWNFRTEWSKTFLKPLFSDSFAKLAVNFGITKHHFEITKLLQKEILVLGGIERGTPSTGLTFCSMMNKIKYTAHATTKEQETPPRSSQQQCQTDVPLGKNVSASSEDSTPLNVLFHKEKENQTENPLDPLTDDQSLPSPLLAMSKVLESAFVQKELYEKSLKENQLLTSQLRCTRSRVEEIEQELKLSAAKILHSEERTYRAMEDVKILEETVRNLKSESARDHVKIKKESINAFKSSDEFREICERMKKDAVKDYKDSEEYVNSFRQERDKITEQAINAYVSSNEFRENCEKMKKDAVKAFQCSDEYFSSLHREREVGVKVYKSSAEFEDFCADTRREAIQVYKTSSDFYTAVLEESVKHYNNGFQACKFQFLNNGQLPKGFNFGFLDPSAGMFGKPPEQVHGGSSTSTSAPK